MINRMVVVIEVIVVMEIILVIISCPFVPICVPLTRILFTM